MLSSVLKAGVLLFALFASACGNSSDEAKSDAGGQHTGGKSSGGTSSGGSSSGGTSSGGTSSGGTSSGGTSSGGTSSGGTNTGGTSTGGSAGGVGKKTYSTNFDGTEKPISEGGVWTNGGQIGLDWQNVEKDQGIAFGSGFSDGYNDCLAHLSGFAPNHYAEATLHVASGYTPPSSHEIELLLRFEITAHSARGYEINNGWNGAYSQIVRWNGPLDDFTYLDTTGPGFGALVEGDVIRATAIGSTITVYKNGNEVLSATDSTWSDGNPGMAMFIRPGTGAETRNYCFTAYAAGDL
jgi:hypothetical protein